MSSGRPLVEFRKLLTRPGCNLFRAVENGTLATRFCRLRILEVANKEVLFWHNHRLCLREEQFPVKHFCLGCQSVTLAILINMLLLLTDIS
jgi:hypothetical protein